MEHNPRIKLSKFIVTFIYAYARVVLFQNKWNTWRVSEGVTIKIWWTAPGLVNERERGNDVPPLTMGNMIVHVSRDVESACCLKRKNSFRTDKYNSNIGGRRSIAGARNAETAATDESVRPVSDMADEATEATVYRWCGGYTRAWYCSHAVRARCGEREEEQ